MPTAGEVRALPVGSAEHLRGYRAGGEDREWSRDGDR